MEDFRKDDETEAAVLEAIRTANADDAYPTIEDLKAVLTRHGLSANDIAGAADRLYRSNRISVNSGGGLHVRNGQDR